VNEGARACDDLVDLRNELARLILLTEAESLAYQKSLDFVC
jgi:hypothetical protein